MATTSVRHCWSCIGCRYTIESSSSWVFWCTWHTMDSRRCTIATPWRQSVAYHLVGDYALLTQQTTWCQVHVLSLGKEHSVFPSLWSGTLSPSHCELSIPSQLVVASCHFLSDSLYVSKRGAYWDRLCRDVVGRWLVGWLSRACTVAKRCILGL